MKKALTMVVTAALVICAFCTAALAADWTEFAVDSSNNSITDAETPKSAEEAELIFKAQIKDPSSWDAMSNVIAAGDYIYVAVGSTIKKFDKEGTEVSSATLTASIAYGGYIAYSNGVLFAYVNDFTNGYIEAVDASTMQRIWVSEPMVGMNGFSPITISGGILYTAVSGYDYVNYIPLTGSVIAMTITDDDTGSQDEVKPNSFTYTAGETYYWNGVAVSGNVAIAGSYDGTLQTIDTTTGLMIDTYEAGERIASSITYIGTTAYFGTASGLGSITVQADGQIVDATYDLVNLGDVVSTTPVVHGGRIYVGTGGFSGGSGLIVIELSTLTPVYSVQVAGTDPVPVPVAGIQGTPVLTTAYTGNTLYFAANAYPGAITMIKDSASQSAEDVTTIFTPDSADQQYTSCSIVAGDDGTLYYTLDSGILFAVGIEDVVTNPQTGDSAGIVLYLLIGAAITAALAFAARKLLQKA